MLSAAAADVEDIFDFIGSGGISGVDWTGIPLNKVTFLCIFFSLFVPSVGTFALLEKEEEKEYTLISFNPGGFVFLCETTTACTEDKPRGLPHRSLSSPSLLHLKWQMAAVSSWNRSMELFVWTETIQLLSEPASYLTK